MDGMAGGLLRQDCVANICLLSLEGHKHPFCNEYLMLFLPIFLFMFSSLCNNAYYIMHSTSVFLEIREADVGYTVLPP